MAVRPTFRSLDLVFSLETTEPKLRALLDELLQPMATRAPAEIHIAVKSSDSTTFAVHVGDELVCITEHASLALAHVLWEINRRAIERTADALLLHASAVERAGHAVLLPGRSGSGKSTLAAALVAAGFGYLTDDAVMIDASNGRARVYPKPIGLGHDVVGLLPRLASLREMYEPYMGDKWFVSAAMLGGSTGADSSPRVVVFPRYAAASNRVVPVSRAEALVLLAENSFNFTQLGPGVLDGLAQVLMQCACYRFEFSDAARVVEFVGDVLAGSPDRIEIG